MNEQNFANHGRIVPLYHWFAFGALAVNFAWSLYRLKQAQFSLDSIVSALVAAALIVLFFYARIFALTVQDRVIRLEERLRFERLLPADLKPRIGEFTVGQLVALRFASDAELPELARAVLSEKLDDRKAVKQRIKNWRADYLRA